MSELINNVMSEDLILVHCWLVVSQPISSMWWDLTMDIDVIFETWLVNYFLYFVVGCILQNLYIKSQDSRSTINSKGSLLVNIFWFDMFSTHIEWSHVVNLLWFMLILYNLSLTRPWLSLASSIDHWLRITVVYFVYLYLHMYLIWKQGMGNCHFME